MWARTQLKIDWGDLLAGGTACIVPCHRTALREKVERYFPDDLNVMAAYSVRSGFDLLLQALDLDQGDEILFSALNVKGMVTIARRAGMVPVPRRSGRGANGAFPSNGCRPPYRPNRKFSWWLIYLVHGSICNPLSILPTRTVLS